MVCARQNLPLMDTMISLHFTIYTQFGDLWRLVLSRKHASPLPPFIAPHVTISHLEREGGQRSLGELPLGKGRGSLNVVKFG